MLINKGVNVNKMSLVVSYFQDLTADGQYKLSL